MPDLFSLPVSGWGWAFAALSLLGVILSIWAILRILRDPREPMAMLAWVLGIFLFPFLGVGLYYLIGERRVRRKGRKVRRRVEYISRAMAFLAPPEEAREEAGSGFSPAALTDLDPGLAQLATISARLADCPLTSGNEVEAFTCAQDVYRSLLESIDAAEDHIHLEYYIFRPDGTGTLFRDRLLEAVRRGVEVRILLDGVGSFGTRRRILGPLEEAGGRVEIFLPAIPLRRPWHINCRNHRKIAVFDGKVAYTGSQNIGDEHRGLLYPRTPWRETHLRIAGPAARQLQEAFIEDWYFAAEEDLVSRRYLRTLPARGGSLVQVVPSGPDQEHQVLYHIFFSALSLARKSIRISTPYFVPGPGLILALQNAAYRGVDVEILIPSVTDSRLVLWAGRSYYQELLRAGVRIHEYDHGMLHSKTVLIDDRWSLVGSANMDIRSFLLNFEITASVFDGRIAGELEEDFRATRSRSREIRRRAEGKLNPIGSAVIEGAARLFSPLL